MADVKAVTGSDNMEAGMGEEKKQEQSVSFKSFTIFVEFRLQRRQGKKDHGKVKIGH
jgi:hypothetical protein